MKDQYFGDVNDYRKYGLLRAMLEGNELRLGVCWLRIANDHRPDGEFRQYLQRPERWRHYDPELYDALRRLLEPGVERTVLHAESWTLLPRASYHHDFLSDNVRARRSYFEVAGQRLHGVELLFLDPDNGLQVQSVGYGQTKSQKYLYWCEAEQAYARGHSLVIYQHFPRQERDAFVESVSKELQHRLGGSRVESFRTANVVFLAAIRPEHRAPFEGARDRVLHRWNGQIC